MKKFKSYMLFLLLAGSSAKGYTQSSFAGAPILQSLEAIYRNYDSIPFMSFDVTFNYSSDTLAGNFINEQMKGTYTLAGKRAKYTLGDIDFMQNESYFIAVYNKDKIILVDEPKMNNSGSQLPMREQIDMLLKGYANQYSIVDWPVGLDRGQILLMRSDSNARFNRFSLDYDSRTHLLYEIVYDFPELEEPDPNTPSYAPIIRKKNLTVSFSNYRFDNYDDDVYRESNYIFFENGVCKPAQKYEGFKIYNSKPVVADTPVSAY